MKDDERELRRRRRRAELELARHCRVCERGCQDLGDPEDELGARWALAPGCLEGKKLSKMWIRWNWHLERLKKRGVT